jgi:integration host factor subunit beta
MVKSGLIARISNKFQQLPEKDVEQCINQLLRCIGKALSKGNRVEIRGFGSFSLRHHPPRNAHNPRTGKKFITPAKHVVHFKPGIQMRERINESRLKKISIQKDEGEMHS